MDEYIRRGEAIEQFEDSTSAISEKLARIRIKEIPAADVAEVRHGRWINGRCSECGEHAPFWAMATTYHLSKYCHGCGAKMEGGQDDGT